MPKVIGNKQVPLSSLKGWDKNPRTVYAEDFERLKRQITQLGVYVPLVVNEDGVVLSGNMRLKAFTALGIDPVWVTVVEAKDEASMIEYALSGNDRIGQYDEEALAELIQNAPAINARDYKIDLGIPVSLEDLLKDIGVTGDGDSTNSDSEQVEFTCQLHIEQDKVVREAVALAKSMNGETYHNGDSDGNAVYWICQEWLAHRPRE